MFIYFIIEAILLTTLSYDTVVILKIISYIIDAIKENYRSREVFTTSMRIDLKVGGIMFCKHSAR